MKPVIENLYVHVPFCTHLCPYCDFPKERLAGNRMRDFLAGMRAEWAAACEELEIRPRHVFFGGGTPTALSPALMEQLLSVAPWSHAEEWSVEANPDGFGETKARQLAAAGVTRISLGVQAFRPSELTWLGRKHDRAAIRQAVQSARAAGIQSLNLDLIYGLPDQGPAEWQETLAEACALQPDSISAYAITPEEGTELAQRIARGEWNPDEDREAVLFLLTCRFLEARGYQNYEVSNFARPAHECRHHQAVWSGEDYLGLGPGAVSTIGGRRWRNLRDTGAYAQSWLLGSGPRRQEEESRTAEEVRTERILLGLRTRTGLAEQGLAGQEEWLEVLVRKGWALREEGRFRLTARGRLRADEVAAMLT